MEPLRNVEQGKNKMDIAKIKQELNEYETKSIFIADELEFSQFDLITKIIYYYNSKFISGEYDDQNDKKYFFNIVRNPCDVATKAIDFDTKNINILTASGGTSLRTWFLERDLKFWMKDKKFGKVLNRIFHELPIFGSVVLKIVNGKIFFVDLKNFAVQQDANNLDEARYIIETHLYSPLGFKKVELEKGWDNWEEALGDEQEEIKVYERYGEDDNLDYRRTIAAEVGKGGVILSDDIVEKHPYREFHLDKVSGRWLGIGKVELLSDPQIRINELTNQQAKSSYLSTLRLWQTRDTGVRRNLLTDAINGQILQTPEEIKQIDMVDRNLSFYEVEINRWLTNKDEITFAHEAIRGERLPSGTPLGSARLAVGQAGAYFAQIQENVALDVKDLLFEVVIPQSKKDLNKEHILRLTGEDLDKINNLIIDNKTEQKVVEFVFKKGRFPSKPQVDLMKGAISEQVKKGKEQLIKVLADSYKDLKYKIDIVITGEQMDTRVKAATLFAAIQAVTADPTLLSDSTKKKFFYRWLEQGGINPIDFEPESAPPSMEQAVERIGGRAGGGVSKPAFAPGQAGGNLESTI
ncbi:MAG: hypothetical protein ACTSPI_12810 [Candidatus Heimdallarchaeaceae archaeon]